MVEEIVTKILTDRLQIPEKMIVYSSSLFPDK